MAREQNGNRDQNFGDPFPDATKPKKPKGKQPSIRFLLGTKERKRKQPIAIDDGVKSQIAPIVEWGCIIANDRVLKFENPDKPTSEERKAVKKYLDALLTGLAERYTSETAKAFPTNEELTRLTEVVTVLAGMLGKMKTDFGDLLGAIKLIENKFSKLGLLNFADKLCDRLCRIPASPASVVHRAAEQNPTTKPVLATIENFLTGKVAADKATPWEDWDRAIQKLVFPVSPLITTRDGKQSQPVSKKGQQRLMDLLRQQQEWNDRYGKATRASLRWIYLLLRPGDYTKLIKTFYGTALAPDEMKKAISELENRERRNRSYKKTITRRDQKPKK